MRLLLAEAKRRGISLAAPQNSGLSKYIPHRPHAGPQSEFLALSNREAFYGGAAGGGKSDALLMGALEYVHVPNYSALILRRTFADLSLPDAIMSRAEQWLINTDAKWNGTEKTWRFPSGATLTFGYLEHEKDKYRYQGSAFQFIGFDELTQFTETQYLYLFSRLRRLKDSPVPLRMRSASNPGGEGHEWVKGRFVVAENPERIFVPARLSDNPSLDQEDYIQSLMELDPVTLAQLLSGDWDVLPQGPLFTREMFKIVHHPSPLARWVRYYDLATSVKAAADKTAGALVGVKEDGTIQIADVVEWKREWPDVRDGYRDERGIHHPGLLDLVEADLEFCKNIQAEHKLERAPSITVGVEAQGMQLALVQDLHRNDKFLKVPLHGVKAKGDKKERASTWAARGSNKPIELVIGHWNSSFIAQCLPFDGEGVLHDDMVDAVSGAVGLLYKLRGGTIENKPAIQPGSYAYYKRLSQQASRRSA